MDDDQLTEIKHDAELGAMAYMNQDDMQQSIRMTAEVLGLVNGILTDLVQALPDREQEEYQDDLTRIRELLPFIR